MITYLVHKASFQRILQTDSIQFFVIVTKMRKAAKPNGHWISEVSVSKKSSTEFTINMSPARCGDNLPLFNVLGAQASGSKDEKIFNFTEFVSGITIRRDQAANPPLTGVFDLSQLDKTVKGEISESSLLLNTIYSGPPCLRDLFQVVQTQTMTAYSRPLPTLDHHV